jgi:hypothetical protein
LNYFDLLEQNEWIIIFNFVEMNEFLENEFKIFIERERKKKEREFKIFIERERESLKSLEREREREFKIFIERESLKSL